MPPFWATPKENHGWTIDNNGTAFLLNCGEETFVVSAAHVFEHYWKKRSESKKIHAQLGNIFFPMEERTLSFLGANTIDIVTFRISEKEVEKLKYSILYGNQNQWRLPQPKEGWVTLFAGYPGRERLQLENASYSYGLYSALTPASSNSDRNIGCAFNRNGWIDVRGNGLPNVGYDLGGVSGGPLLIVLESKGKIISWRLGGVVYNTSSTICEIMLAHHASYIYRNGTLHA